MVNAKKPRSLHILRNSNFQDIHTSYSAGRPCSMVDGVLNQDANTISLMHRLAELRTLLEQTAKGARTAPNPLLVSFLPRLGKYAIPTSHTSPAPLIHVQRQATPREVNVSLGKPDAVTQCDAAKVLLGRLDSP